MPINHKDLEYIGPQVPMYNFDTKIVGNSSWQQLEIYKRKYWTTFKKECLITSLFNSRPDSVINDLDNLADYQLGFYSSKLLTALDMNEISRTAFNKSLKEIDMFHGEGFNYYPSPSNKNVNSAFQLIDFNGKDFIRSGRTYD